MEVVLAPTALLSVRGGDYHWFVVGSSGVIVKCSGGLGTKVAGVRIEIRSADSMCTVSARELHSALDALNSVGFH